MAQHPERAWDEYDWERFLKEQDRKTERYMELMERYGDHPNRDEIIAQEMGWQFLLDDETCAWSEADEFSADTAPAAGVPDEEIDWEPFEFDSFEKHPLYQTAFRLTVWIDQWIEEIHGYEHLAAAVKLVTYSAVASAKLAAALSDDDIEEIGMTIAYLKRALKAVTICLEAALQLEAGQHIGAERATALKDRLFQLRDGIITLMGECRAEFRRRHGGA